MRSYPRTQFEVVNNTSVLDIPSNVVSGTRAIMMMPYTSDKGSEDWELLDSLTDFTNRKGGLNFSKHGQAQFTVANLLTNGSLVLGKRMVSPDATLANATIRARVIQANEVSYVYLYTTTATGQTTFEGVCEEGYDSFDADAEPITGSSQGDSETYQTKSWDIPLFTVAALGRGVSGISFSLKPEYYTSKSGQYMKYSFEVLENADSLERISCTFNPDAIIEGVNQSIQNKIDLQSSQVIGKIYEDGILKFSQLLAATAVRIEKALEVTESGTQEVEKKVPIMKSELINLDIINGYDKKQNPISGIVTMNIAEKAKALQTLLSSAPESLWEALKPSDIETPVMLNMDAGIALTGGTFGTMGVSPVSNTEEYAKLLLATFGAVSDKDTDEYSLANYDPVIYDLDRYKVDAIFDCGWSTAVKNAIIDLVDFRGDCVFIGDLGVKDAKTLGDVKEKYAAIKKSKYAAIYCNYFDIVDPFTRKQITVTMPYLLAPKLVSHIATGVGRPFAGIANGLTFPEIIERSINFLPSYGPDYDQKQELADLGINYLGYYDGLPVMESMWVNDDSDTQLSYLHNVMAIQEIIKVLRTRCPRTRYTFLEKTDFEQYLSDTNAIINEYKSNFGSIEMTYVEDDRYKSNNIFYAEIKVRFMNFINEEFFRVIAFD